MAPSAPVRARYVRFLITPQRFFSVSEVQVLDAITYEPFDLKIALPDGTDRSDISKYNPTHFISKSPDSASSPQQGKSESREISHASAPKLADREPQGASRELETGKRDSSSPAARVVPLTANTNIPDAAKPGELIQEVPTLKCLGVRWLIGGDGNANARIAVDYRPVGVETWKQGLDLFRVETAGIREPNRPAAGQTLFAGSIFDLAGRHGVRSTIVLAGPRRRRCRADPADENLVGAATGP